MQSDEVSQIRRWLGATGFSENLELDEGRLKAPSSGEPLDPDEITVSAAYRCERGEGQQTTVFAIATAGGEPMGTFAAEHGPSTSPEMQSIVAVLEARSEVPAAVCDQSGHQHIAAVFPDRESAGIAVAELRDQGLGSDHLGVAVHGADRVTFERPDEVSSARTRQPVPRRAPPSACSPEWRSPLWSYPVSHRWG